MQLDGILFFILMLLIGYLSLRLHLVSEAATDVLPALLLKVCFPAMLFLTFSQTDSRELIHTGLPTVLATLVFALLPFFLSIPLLRKMDDSRRPLLRYIAGIGNTSFVCLPLLSLFLNSTQLSIVFIHGAVMDFLIWGVHHQIFVGSSFSGWRTIAKNIFLSPNLLAVVAGLLCSGFSVKLPEFLTFTLEKLSATVSPLSLLFIGMLICQYGLLDWIKSKTAIVYSLWKVLVLPALAYTVLSCCLPQDATIILAILFGSPAPISAVLWCKQYGKDTALAVSCLIPSTLLYFALYGTLLALLTSRGVL